MKGGIVTCELRGGTDTRTIEEVQRPKKKSKSKKLRVGLSRMEEEKLKRAIRRVVPSESWLESQFASFADVDAGGQEIVYRFHNPRAFPPKGDLTPMVQCPLCGRTVPSISVEAPLYPIKSGHPHGIRETAEPRCMDCRPMGLQEAWGDSPSAKAIREIQFRHLRLDSVKLESEEVQDLQREIREYWRAQGPSPHIRNHG